MKVTVNGNPVTCDAMTVRQLLDLTCPYEFPYERPLLAYVDGRLSELGLQVSEGMTIRSLTITDKAGYETYRRSAVMLLLAAFRRLYGNTVSDTVLHFAVGSGFYFTFGNDVVPDSKFAESLKAEMVKMRDEAIPFEKKTVPTYEARKIFEALHMPDKARLFKTRMTSRVNIYTLEGFEDYYYGYMVPDTSLLWDFDLIPLRDGIALNLPERTVPCTIPEFEMSGKLMDIQLEGEEWAERQGISTVPDLNEKIIYDKASEAILISEAMQEGRIAEIAAKIRDSAGVKFVMIAGPSSSGKTTFSQRLSTQLSACGLIPHYIGTDNYFINRDAMPVGPDGKRDFEGLDAVDVALFNKDMETLLNGGRVELPYFDFVEGKRGYRGDFLELKDGELLVIEGIHSLNEELSTSLPKESKFKIYISALTQLNIDRHNRVPASDGRLLRRIVRDHRTRGACASSTIAMWDSVRAGETKNIFPYQESADAVFNSALPYEIAVLKTYAQPLLLQVEEDDPSYQEAKRLLKFLDYFIAIPSEGVPGNSLLREFIGGGCYHL